MFQNLIIAGKADCDVVTLFPSRLRHVIRL